MTRRTVNLGMPLALACGLVLLSTNAAASQLSPAAVSARIDSSSKTLAEVPIRTFGKSAAYCTAQHQPDGPPLDERLKNYSADMSLGTRDALLEITKTDTAFLKSVPTFDSKDFERMDKKADTMLQSIRAAPAAGCAKLSAILDEGTRAFFKELTLKSYREYQTKRAQYCAAQPKSADCD